MPDDYGRYTLAELRVRVWRRLNAIRATTVDPNTGAESGDPIVDQLFSQDDVDGEINTALTAAFCAIITNSDIVFGDEEYVDIKANITEYELPSDMLQLRGLYWKDESITYTQLPVNQRTPMYLFDGQTPVDDVPGPTYRLQLNNFVLNHPPKKDNPGGVLVRYIKVINFLAQDGDIIESQYARIIQELVIVDSAIKLLESRSNLIVPDRWTLDLQTWQERLNNVTRNALNPPVILMAGTHYLRRGR